MMRTVNTLLTAVVLAIATAAIQGQTAVPCTPGAAPQWGAGWCDFSTPASFKKGDRLRIAIGGSATKIIVRLLPSSAKGREDTPVGALPAAIAIPQNRFIEVVLPYDAMNITQISVHGGPSPWNQYPLGARNGPATITGIERLPATAGAR